MGWETPRQVWRRPGRWPCPPSTAHHSRDGSGLGAGREATFLCQWLCQLSGRVGLSSWECLLRRPGNIHVVTSLHRHWQKREWGPVGGGHGTSRHSWSLAFWRLLSGFPGRRWGPSLSTSSPPQRTPGRAWRPSTGGTHHLGQAGVAPPAEATREVPTWRGRGVRKLGPAETQEGTGLSPAEPNSPAQEVSLGLGRSRCEEGPGALGARRGLETTGLLLTG